MALREFASHKLLTYLNTRQTVFHQPCFSALTWVPHRLNQIGTPVFLWHAPRHLSSTPPSPPPSPPSDPTDNVDFQQPQPPKEEDVKTNQTNQACNANETHKNQTSLHREADAQRHRMHQHQQLLANRERFMTMKHLAQLATQSMLPWERAHMDGDACKKPLTIYEKVYWILFGLVAVPGLMYELCYPQLVYGRDIVRTVFHGHNNSNTRVREDDMEVLVSSNDQGSQ